MITAAVFIAIVYHCLLPIILFAMSIAIVTDTTLLHGSHDPIYISIRSAL